MPPYATEEMIWAHLAEVRRQARRTRTTWRRPARVVVGELLVGVGLRLMAETDPTTRGR